MAASSACAEAAVVSTRGKGADDQHQDDARVGLKSSGTPREVNGKCHTATSPGSGVDVALARADVKLNGKCHKTACARFTESDDDAAAVELDGECHTACTTVQLAPSAGSGDDDGGGGAARQMREQHNGTKPTRAHSTIQEDGATATATTSSAPGRRQRVFDLREWVLSTYVNALSFMPSTFIYTSITSRVQPYVTFGH